MAQKDMHGSELIIALDGTLYHINLKNTDGIPRRVIYVGSQDRPDLFARYFIQQTNGQPLIKFRTRNREYVTIVGEFEGVPVAIMSTGIGTDNTEIALVETHALFNFDHLEKIWAKPSKRSAFLRVGTAGSPQSKTLGKKGVGTIAIGTDSTGIHIPYISPDPLVEEVRGTFRNAAWQSLKSTPLNEIMTVDQSVLELRKSLLIKKYENSPLKDRLDFNSMVELGIKKEIFSYFRPYVSKASPVMVEAIISGATYLGYKNELEIGGVCSAGGFYSNQGRQIDEIPVLLLYLQDILEKLRFGDLRFTFNEMESSLLFRLGGEVLHNYVGSICLILADRHADTFLSKVQEEEEMNKTILIGLKAITSIDLPE